MDLLQRRALYGRIQEDDPGGDESEVLLWSV